MARKNHLEWTTAQHLLEMAADQAGEIAVAGGQRALPVDPLAVAEAERRFLRVCGDNFRESFDGMLEYHRSKSRFLLFFNTKYDRLRRSGAYHPRTRFSIAHELGHYFLEKHRAYLMGGGDPHRSRGEFETDKAVEREADAFAAGLLMPAALFRPVVNKSVLTGARIEDLADRFQTSLVSTAIRAVQLSDFPCCVAGVRAGAVAWRFQSQALVEGGCYPVPKGPVPSESSKRQWLAFETGSAQKTVAESKLTAWFETYESDRLESVFVAEHFLPVPSMGTLLVLLTVAEDDLFGEGDE